MPFTNDTKPSTVFTADAKPSPATEQELLIGEGFFLSIGDGFRLLIQGATSGTTWNNDTEPT